MADDITLTQEQLELLQRYNALTDDAKKKWSAIVDQLSNSEQLVTSLLGKQADYASENDKILAFTEEMVRRQKEQLVLEQERDALLAKQANKKSKLSKREKERLEEIIKLTGTEAQMDADSLKILKDKIKASEKLLQSKKEIQTLEENSEKIVTNQLSQMTGISHEASNLGELLAQNVGKGQGFSATMEGVSKAFAKTFTKANMLMWVVGKMGELADEFEEKMLSAGGALMKFADTDIRFVQETGGLMKFGTELRNLKAEFNNLNITFDETESAYYALFNSSTLFATQIPGITKITAEQRAELTQHVAELQRFGVSASTAAKNIDMLSKTMRMSSTQVRRMQKDMVKFGRAMGVGPNKMLEQMNSNMNLLAKYGKEQGAAVFKELAATSQLAGVEMEKLVGIAKTFDTFESAAEAAGKLNFVLGGPMINSVDMLNMSESERIKTLRQSVLASGRAFDEMGRFEKELIAKTLGTSVDVAQRLFNDENINSIEEATAAIQAQADGMGDLSKEARKNTTVGQAMQLVDEAKIASMKDFADNIRDVNNAFLEFKKAMAPVTVAIGAVTSAIKYLGIAALGAWTFFGGGIGKLMSFLGGGGLKGAIVGVGASIARVFGAGGSGPQQLELFSNASKNTNSIWSRMTKTVSKWGTMAKNGIQGVSSRLSSFVGRGGLLSRVATGFTGFFGKISSGFTGLIGKVGKFGSGLSSLAGGGKGGSGGGLFAKMGRGLRSLGSGAMRMAKSAAGGIARTAGRAVTGVLSAKAAALGTAAAAGGYIGHKINEGIYGEGNVDYGSMSDLRGIGRAIGFADGVTGFQGGSAIVGERGPEMVTLPRGSNVITNENIEKLLGAMTGAFANSGTQTDRAPGVGQTKEQAINITLELDGEVLARHTATTAMQTLTDAFSFSGRGW